MSWRVMGGRLDPALDVDCRDAAGDAVLVALLGSLFDRMQEVVDAPCLGSTATVPRGGKRRNTRL